MAEMTEAQGGSADSSPPRRIPIDATPHERRYWVLAVLSISIFMVFVDGTVVNTALPAISLDLRASTSELQFVTDAYILILAGLLLVGGTIGDRFGRKRWLTVGLVIFGGGAVGAALSSSVEILVLFRGVQGAGAALILPATLSILTAVFPRQERARAIAIWTAVGGLGVAFGPAAGGFLVDEIDWNAVFWLHLPFVGLALVGGVIVPESRDPRQLRLDVPGAVLATFGLIALVFGIIRGNEAGWASVQVLGSLAGAAVLLIGFAIVEVRSEAPMLPLQFFRQRDFSGAVIIIGLAWFALFGVFFLLTQFFQLVQGRSAFEAGLLIVPAAFGMVFSSLLAGILSQTAGPKNLVVVSMITILAGMLLLSQIDTGTGALYLAGSLFLFGFGFGLGMPALTDTVMAAVPVGDAGIGSAVNDVSRELGGALGIAVTGSIVSALYRADVKDSLAGEVPTEVADSAGEGIGVARIVAQDLPTDVAAIVTEAANTAFTDAFTTGIVIGAVIMAGTAIIAAALIPWRMRATQATERRLEPVPAAEPTPAPAPAAGQEPAPAPLLTHPHPEGAPFGVRFMAHCYGFDFLPWVRCNG